MSDDRLPTTLTGFMALMDADGDLPLGVIQALLDEVERLTAENARLKGGVGRIAAERQRQIDAEGWTDEHDDAHDRGELITAADAYLFAALANLEGVEPTLTMLWPWDVGWWKPSMYPGRNLIKAGALIAAEIDRLDRAAGAASRGTTQEGNE